MVNQNKIFLLKIKHQAKNVFPRYVEKTVVFEFFFSLISSRNKLYLTLIVRSVKE